MTDELEFALVGCGAATSLNAHSIDRARGARLVRVVDADPTEAKRASCRFRVPCSTTLAAALEDPLVYAVFIATASDLRAAMIVEAARAGRHVIVDTPIATTVADAQWALMECERAGVALSVCHTRRYRKPIDCAHRALEEGVIGRLLLSTTHFMRNGSDRSRRPATRRAPRAWCGDDVFLTSLLHHLDALQAVAGESITELRGLSTILSNGGGEEESVAATLRYEGGALGAVVTCLSPPGPSLFQDSFVGTDGRLLVDKRIVQVIRRGAESPYHPKEWCTWEFPAQDDSRLRFVEEFCRSVQTGEPPPVPAAYGIELLRLIAQATRPSGAELRGCASP